MISPEILQSKNKWEDEWYELIHHHGDSYLAKIIPRESSEKYFIGTIEKDGIYVKGMNGEVVIKNVKTHSAVSFEEQELDNLIESLISIKLEISYTRNYNKQKQNHEH